MIHPVHSAPVTITLASDYRCPYCCNPEDSDPGYLVELAQKIFEIYGIKVEYKMMPWSDVLKAASDGEIDGIMGISEMEGENLLLPKTPQIFSNTYVFSRTDIHCVYDEPESLIGKKIAMVLDYTIDNSELRKYITMTYLSDPWSFVVESGINAVADSINSVIDKTADVYIGDQKIVNNYLNNNKLHTQINNCGKVGGTPIKLYIAFADTTPKAAEYIKMLEDGMRSITSIGDLANLRKKYQITDQP